MELEQIPVRVYGDFLPRHFLGLFHIFFATLRSFWLALYLYYFTPHHFDLIFVDQIPFTIPILRRCAERVLFYCHFPDQYLAPRTANPLRRLYRLLFDRLEEWSMLRADRILVNSAFTARQFRKAFPSASCTPSVLYPGVEIPLSLALQDNSPWDLFFKKNFVIVSLNRFERKKNLPLAISSFYWLSQRLTPPNTKPIRLLMAGGFDPRVKENAQVLAALESHCQQLGIDYTTFSRGVIIEEEMDHSVLFLPSIPDHLREFILTRADCLVYTPTDEHLGLVPLEAMIRGTPAIAINSGGPKETIVDGNTGFLCAPSPSDIGSRLLTLYRDEVSLERMGKEAREHVTKAFSMETFGDRLEEIIHELLLLSPPTFYHYHKE